MKDKLAGKINIALVCTSLNQIGGKNVHFKNMYLHLNDERFKIIIILCTSLEKHHRSFMLQEGVADNDVIFIPRFKKWFLIPFIIELAKILKARHIDIIHTFQIQSDIFGSLAAYFTGVDCIVSHQESKIIEEDIPLLKNLFYRTANFFLKKKFAKTIVVSEGLKNELIAQNFRPTEKIELIHLGIDITKKGMGKDCSFHRLQNGIPVIGTISRLDKEKGIDRFISAMPYVLEAIPNASFFIGGAGEEELALRELAHSLNLDSKLVFGGWINKVDQIWENIDIFVMPSLREGCPNVLLEALAFGRSVIASNIDGIREIIKDGYNGVLVNTADQKILSEKIIFLCKNPEKAIDLGKNGQQSIATDFTIQQEMDKYRALYRQSLPECHI